MGATLPGRPHLVKHSPTCQKEVYVLDKPTTLHPYLYSSAFIKSFFNLDSSTVAHSATGHQGTSILRCYGSMKFHGRHAYVFIAEHVAIWITNRKSNPCYLTPLTVDYLFRLRIEFERKHSLLCPSQLYLETVPYEDIIWISDYVHHGGKTILTKEGNRGISETSTK